MTTTSYHGYDEETETSFYGVRSAFDVMAEMEQAEHDAYEGWEPESNPILPEPYVGKHRSGKIKWWPLKSYRGQRRAPKEKDG